MLAPVLAPVAYGLLNVFSATGIVFANKSVFAVFEFNFTYALTFIHTVFTMIGMQIFLRFNVFELKQVPRRRLIPLAAAYVGYIVLCNLNLNLNPVGFYQITKIVVAPAVLGIEALWYGRRSSSRVTMAVLVVCLGVALATITDPQLSSNAVGLVVGFGSVAATALYQIWAGVMQRELGLGSMQLLHQYVPLATLMLGGLTVVAEPVGWGNPVRGTLLGYTPTTAAVVAILVSAALGLLVNLSTFLVIGATSSLTYNVVGHVKTVLILSGGVLFFGDAMPLKKAAGIGVAMLGIIWYSQVKLQEARAAAAAKLTLPSINGANGSASGALGNGGASEGMGFARFLSRRTSTGPPPLPFKG
ncbi:hypothetical protein H632_c585p1 [Helicosporidium sp. ATCC 50920]|nr:hypothetical protein H632_c585p1 [Helicosporidium sp. ATCC 50920]|eukprot:KDD75625.1 hypothetical protein H632_c585p1 [Helicosporidium sp. ATCC 50920]